MSKAKNILLAVVGIILVPQGVAIASEIESILDRLERKLKDQETEILSFDEESALKNGPVKPSEKKLKLGKQSITGSLKSEDRLKALSTAISKIEDEIEELVNDVQATKQKSMEKAKIDNFVEIDTLLLNPDKTSIKALTVKIDGYIVYEVDDAAGMWLPTNKLPIYAGPMLPGDHKLDLVARLAFKEGAGLPVNGMVFRSITKNVDVSIPNGSVRKKFTIDIAMPETIETSKESKKVKSKLKEEKDLDED